MRKRVSKIGKGVFSERGYPCGTRGISLHGSTAPTPPRGRFHRDPAAVNPHICVVGRGESFFIASQFTMLQTTQIFFYKIPLVGAKRAGRIGARANSAALTLTKVGNDLTPPLSVNKRLSKLSFLRKVFERGYGGKLFSKSFPPAASFLRKVFAGAWGRFFQKAPPKIASPLLNRLLNLNIIERE